MTSAHTSPETVPRSQCCGKPIGQRERRLLTALLQRPLSREDADRICHASNSPDVVFRLRKQGVPVETERVPFMTIDGDPSHYGRYRLDEVDKPIARQLLWEVSDGKA